MEDQLLTPRNFYSHGHTRVPARFRGQANRRTLEYAYGYGEGEHVYGPGDILATGGSPSSIIPSCPRGAVASGSSSTEASPSLTNASRLVC